MVFLKSYFVNTTPAIDVLNITSEIRAAISDSTGKDGLLTVIIPGAGASVTFFEPVPQLIDELKNTLSSFSGEGVEGIDKKKEKVPIFPRVQAAMLGRTISIPIKEGKLMLAPHEEIFLIDLDKKTKRREFYVQVMAEAAPEEGAQGKPQARRR